MDTASKRLCAIWCVISTLLYDIRCLDNGVALTPPMGWLSWERFECNLNCEDDPDNCISEYLYKKMADIMVSEGYLAAGYEYIAIDDCWLAHSRDAQGRLQPDPERFPSGVKALADYLHAKGLKLGIYEDVGTKTCAGFPGSEGHMQQDAQTLADWGVDMLKFDGCNADIPQFDRGFPEMGRYLNETGRHIVYSCEWPMYESAHGGKPDYARIAATCNLARQLTDIYDSWGSVLGMIDYFGSDDSYEKFGVLSAPGAWNDPDQLVIGNYGLSPDQERAQMALWSMMASPLLFSNDLRHVSDTSRDLLQNRRVIAINQDRLGLQAKRIKDEPSGLSTWVKPILPVGSRAVAFLYRTDHGQPLKVEVKLSDLGLAAPTGYNVTEVFEGRFLGSYRPWDVFSCRVNPTGVYLIKAVPMDGQQNQNVAMDGQQDQNVHMNGQQGHNVPMDAHQVNNLPMGDQQGQNSPAKFSPKRRRLVNQVEQLLRLNKSTAARRFIQLLKTMNKKTKIQVL